jgi:hypothetical protein
MKNNRSSRWALAAILAASAALACTFSGCAGTKIWGEGGAGFAPRGGIAIPIGGGK